MAPENAIDLPESIPLFPLPRVILLPRTYLPLNIFEPRYLAMVQDALASDRMIGMVQVDRDAGGGALCRTGGAGKIVSFHETDDGRYQITLKGVSRFSLQGQPQLADGGYLRARPDWDSYRNDLSADVTTDICRDKMIGALYPYFEQMGMSCDQWEKIRSADCESLVGTLSVVCPFSSAEKQALLEARTLSDRARLLLDFVEKATVDSCCKGDRDTCH